MSFLVTQPKAFAEDGDNEAILEKKDLDKDPLYCGRTRMQFVSLGGGTVDVDVRGPAGQWFEVATNQAENDVLEILGPQIAFRCRFDQAGSGIVWVQQFAGSL